MSFYSEPISAGPGSPKIEQHGWKRILLLQRRLFRLFRLGGMGLEKKHKQLLILRKW